MKRGVILSFIFGMLVLSVALASAGVVSDFLKITGFAVSEDSSLNDGLVIYYPFDSFTGSITEDASGNGNDGAIFGDVHFEEDGISEKSATFDGDKDYVQVSSEIIEQYDDNLSISAWMYIDPDLDQTLCGPLIANAYDYNNNDRYGWTLGRSCRDSIFTFTIYSRDDENNRIGAGASFNMFEDNYLPNGDSSDLDNFEEYSGRWVHVVGVFSAGYSVALYLDNEKVAETLTSIDSIAYSPFDRPFRIGTRSATTKQGFWHGGIDEFRLYDRVLSEEEIEELYGEKDSVQEDVCVDSDGGLNYDGKGETKGPEWATGDYVERVDFCETEGEKAGMLIEYYCGGDDNQVGSESYECPNGCEDGACLPGSDSCSEGKLLEIKSIKDTDGKIEVFYDYDGVSGSDLEVGFTSLDSNSQGGGSGYRVCNVVGGGGGGGSGSSVREGSFLTDCDYPEFDEDREYKVQIKDTTCEGLFDVYEVRFDEEEDPEEERTSCSGCLTSDDKCIPYGFRVVDDYCDISGEILDQNSAGESCVDDYQCQSNECSGGVCVDVQARAAEESAFRNFVVGLLCALANPFDEEGREQCRVDSGVPSDSSDADDDGFEFFNRGTHIDVEVELEDGREGIPLFFLNDDDLIELGRSETQRLAVPSSNPESSPITGRAVDDDVAGLVYYYIKRDGRDYHVGFLLTQEEGGLSYYLGLESDSTDEEFRDGSAEVIVRNKVSGAVRGVFSEGDIVTVGDASFEIVFVENQNPSEDRVIGVRAVDGSTLSKLRVRGGEIELPSGDDFPTEEYRFNPYNDWDTLRYNLEVVGGRVLEIEECESSSCKILSLSGAQGPTGESGNGGQGGSEEFGVRGENGFDGLEVWMRFEDKDKPGWDSIGGRDFSFLKNLGQILPNDEGIFEEEEIPADLSPNGYVGSAASFTEDDEDFVLRFDLDEGPRNVYEYDSERFLISFWVYPESTMEDDFVVLSEAFPANNSDGVGPSDKILIYAEYDADEGEHYWRASVWYEDEFELSVPSKLIPVKMDEWSHIGLNWSLHTTEDVVRIQSSSKFEFFVDAQSKYSDTRPGGAILGKGNPFGGSEVGRDHPSNPSPGGDFEFDGCLDELRITGGPASESIFNIYRADVRARQKEIEDEVHLHELDCNEEGSDGSDDGSSGTVGEAGVAGEEGDIIGECNIDSDCIGFMQARSCGEGDTRRNLCDLKAEYSVNCENGGTEESSCVLVDEGGEVFDGYWLDAYDCTKTVCELRCTRRSEGDDACYRREIAL